jgi:hypothetical protein
MWNRNLVIICVYAASALAGSAPAVLEADEPSSKPNGPITVEMKDCKATRPGKMSTGVGILRLLLLGPPRDQLVKRGELELDGETFALYLPKAASYTLKNTSDQSELANNSTLLSIDQNGDGALTEDEGWYANLPIRVGDRMFDVIEIDKDGSRIVLKPSQAPLRGLIVGRRCPSFTFKTSDDREVSLQTLAGKAFLLDVWSVT